MGYRTKRLLLFLMAVPVLVEFGLALIGYQPAYVSSNNVPLRVAPEVFSCDAERACHFNMVELPALCAAKRQDVIDSTGRICALNPQGFSDTDDFSPPVDDNEYGILALGDSFTFGYTSTLGSGWVEVMEQALQADYPAVQVWNAGITGSGTEQQILEARRWIPVLKPRLVILAFFSGNDFSDNLLPRDRYMWLVNSKGARYLVSPFVLDKTGEPVRVPDEQIYYGTEGLFPLTGVLALLYTTRIGTQFGRFMAQYANTEDRDTREAVVTASEPVTEQLLLELNEVVKQSGAQFLVLAIPSKLDVELYENGQPLTWRYTTMQRILQEHDIPFIEPLPLLAVSDYDLAHWITSGHQKAGQMMAGCVQSIINQLPCPFTQHNNQAITLQTGFERDEHDEKRRTGSGRRAGIYRGRLRRGRRANR